MNMTTIAAGLALEGKKVFTYSIANFPTLRCLEQLRNEACYHELNINVVRTEKSSKSWFIRYKIIKLRHKLAEFFLFSSAIF